MSDETGGYFEAYHQLIDPIRARLADGGLQTIPEDELFRAFLTAKECFDELDAIFTQAATITESARAVGQAIKDEVERRDKLKEPGQ